jgi:TonB family protein
MESKLRVLVVVTALFVLAGCASKRVVAPTKEELDAAAQTPEVQCPQPALPPAVTQAHLSGTTQVEIEVDAMGAVAKAAVAKPSGNTPAHALADEAVVAAVRQCRFPVVPGDGPRTGVMPVEWKG